MNNASRAAVVALIVVLALLPVLAPEVVIVQGTDILIFTLFALSLNLLVGYAGMLSLGHAATKLHDHRWVFARCDRHDEQARQ